MWFATHQRWDLLSFLIDRGVDVSRTYSKDDLRTAASFVANAMEDAKKEKRAPDVSLLRVQSLIIR